MQIDAVEKEAVSTRSRSKAEMYVALIQVVLALVSIGESFRFKYWEEYTGPGAGFVPLWLGIIWLPIAVALLVRSRTAPSSGLGGPALPRGPEARRLVTFLGMLVLFLALFVPVGALITVGAFVAVALRLFEEYRWKPAVLTGSIISVIFYLLFRIWLGVPLPKGVLFFL